jgi:tetratricopeptide (TPR) repeat protein
LKRKGVVALASLGLALLAGCGSDPVSQLSPEERTDRLQDLLVRGVAHAEIDEWAEAIERFAEALPLAGDDPVVVFNLAVAHFRNGDAEAAGGYLTRIDETAPAHLRGRAAYVQGKLALERGDAEEEASAYRRAAEIDPSDPAYPYSLSQVVPRLGGPRMQEEVGLLVGRAAELWPENGRLAAELAQWSLGRPESDIRQRGVDIVVELAAGLVEIEPLLTRGLAEYETDPERPPVSLRRALNLLRPGKRFQTDSALLESRLAVLPFSEPVARELRRKTVPARVQVTLEKSALLPETPFLDGEIVVQIVASNDAIGRAGGASREADLTVLTDRGVWFLARDEASYEQVASLAAPARQLLVGELDGDGWMEIMVVGGDGVAVWGRSEESGWSERQLEPGLAGARELHEVMLLDFEQDGDLDLLGISSNGSLILVTHRGEAGLGAPELAPLPVRGPVRKVAAIDLDNDVDQDLVIATDESLGIFLNWRQGEFRAAGELSPVRGLEQLLSVDYTGDGHFDVVGLAGERLLFWRNSGSGGLTVDEGAGKRAEELAGTDRVRSLTSGDLDLDGDLDLVLAQRAVDGSARMSVLMSEGELGFEVGPQIVLAQDVLDDLALLDMDGDHDPDLVAWGPEGTATASGTGAEAQGWLELSLRGLKGKVPLDGRGARVDVNFGLDSRAYEIERPEIVVGLGGRTAALVKVTWPNGISEFLFEPQSDATHVIEQELRIEGSCPFLYASDGEEKRFVTDILGLAPLGMLSGPGQYVSPDPEEYLRLPDWVAVEDTVELSITEELREVAYLDQVELVVVDAPSNVEVYNGERWIQGAIDGLDLRLLGPLREPAAVNDNRGRDVLEFVRRIDQRYLTNHDGERLYQGAVPPHGLEIEVPQDVAASGRAALVLTGWLHWGNTSTNLARAQDPAGGPIFPYLEVPTGEGGWERLDLDVGLPAGKTKPVVVDLTGALVPEDPRIRVTTDFEVYWDGIAVTETLSTDATDHRIHRLAPASAELSYGGFSRWYRAAENGPYLFDYADRRPYPWRENSSGARPIAWQEHEGFYTRFGSVAELISGVDDRLVVFGAGEELELSFDVGALPSLPDGWKRTLFLHSEGWEKDGDPNVACGQTVGPLPSRGMIAYPCPQSAIIGEGGAADVGTASPEADRWVDRRRLERRVAAWGGRYRLEDGFFSKEVSDE